MERRPSKKQAPAPPTGGYSKNEQVVRARRVREEREEREEKIEREEVETEVDSVMCQKQEEREEEKSREKEEEEERRRRVALLRTPEIQSFPIHRAPLPSPERESLRSRLASSKVVKRSRSFNRIFSYSMLGRSKEYRL